MLSKLDYISAYLSENNIKFEVIQHSVVKTMDDVFHIIQDDSAKMIKAILLKTSINYLLVGIPADKLVDFKLVAKAFESSKNRIRLASAKEIKEITGFEIGSLIPFSLKNELPFIIDSSFQQYEYIYCGSGTHFHTLKIKTSEFIKLPRYREHTISKSI